MPCVGVHFLPLALLKGAETYHFIFDPYQSSVVFSNKLNQTLMRKGWDENSTVSQSV